MASESEQLCCVCLKECTGAHHCLSCKNAVHIPCADSSGAEEGYGSKVTCKNCINVEPPLKKSATDWFIRYKPGKVQELRHKVPSKESAEKRCICMACFYDGKDPKVYVLSRRDSSTKERHVKRRHPSKTVKEVEMCGFECYGEKINAAKKKYEDSMKSSDAQKNGKILQKISLQTVVNIGTDNKILV